MKQNQIVTMYTKVPCPFCVAAKRFFEEHQIEYKEVDLTDDHEKLMEIKRELGWMTVPIISIGQELIGGYTDLKELHDKGQLETKLFVE